MDVDGPLEEPQPLERIPPSELSQMMQWISCILRDQAKRKALLELRDNRAQSCIDGLNNFVSDPEIRRSAEPGLLKYIVIVLRRLCEVSSLYPTCYVLNGIREISLKNGGGFGDIFQGRFKDHFLCLKVARLYQDSDMKQLLKAHAREAILWNQLDHPNVVPFYGIFYWEKRICLVSPWMENGDIVEFLRKKPDAAREPLVDDIAKGLQYLHDKNIVHGDLKGRNVLIDDRRRACLADFGLSSIVTNGTLGFTRTADSASSHTTRWASPELFEGRPTRESDVWAFGCLCYEILTGIEPFTGCSDFQVMLKLMRGELPAQLDAVRLHEDEHLDKRFRGLIRRCWSIGVEQRPQCIEIVEQFEADCLAPSGRDSAETPNQVWFSPPGTTSNFNQLRDLLEQLFHGNEVDSVPDIQDSLMTLESEGSLSPSRPSTLVRHQRFSHSRRSSSHSLRSSSPRPRDGTTTPPSRQSLSPEPPSQPPSLYLPSQQYGNQGIINKGRDITIMGGTFVQSFSPQHLGLTIPSKPPSFVGTHQLSAPQPGPYALMSPQQQPHGVLNTRAQYSRQPQQQNLGMFHQAHNFIAMGNFIDGNVAYNNAPSNESMEKLLRGAILGAEYDSSARDPPPRCHPGTRLAILERCLYFITNCYGARKILWVVGVAGVGKSAVMQNVAEFPELPVSSHASIFFSTDGRDDGTRAVITISYQFTVKSAPYRQAVREVIAHDPSLLQSSMAAQFKKLIVEPFIYNPMLNSAGRFLVIIDGLDECNDPRTQRELLRLISDFCIMCPFSPLVWLISSRPEIHISSFFSKRNVISSYEKEEIPVDSAEAREDIRRFLRDELKEIKDASHSLDPQWPEERNFWKLANAAQGLFAYAYAVIRYIGNSTIQSPVSLLSNVLRVIDNHPMNDLSREEHPMALLDTLYDRILSTIPPKVMVGTRKLLLALASDWDIYFKYSKTGRNLIVLCNWLSMTRDEAYATLNRLPSVLYVPPSDTVHEDLPRPLHKSFIDYISDPIRSKFSSDIQHEARQLKTECAFRTLRETPNGVSMGDMDNSFLYGDLARGSGAGNKISLTWSVGEVGLWGDDATRLRLYKLAIGEIVAGVERRDPVCQSESCIRLLTSRFESYSEVFPRDELRALVFGESRRSEFMEYGILKRIPLEVVEISRSFKAKLQFRRPLTMVIDVSDPWNSSCQHERAGEWEESKDQNWTTEYQRDCDFCIQRFKHQLDKCQIQSPDHTAVGLSTSTGECCVEIRLIDPEDGVSEWTYWLWCNIPLEGRTKYGSLV